MSIRFLLCQMKFLRSAVPSDVQLCRGNTVPIVSDVELHF